MRIIQGLEEVVSESKDKSSGYEIEDVLCLRCGEELNLSKDSPRKCTRCQNNNSDKFKIIGKGMTREQVTDITNRKVQYKDHLSGELKDEATGGSIENYKASVKPGDISLKVRDGFICTGCKNIYDRLPPMTCCSGFEIIKGKWRPSNDIKEMTNIITTGNING